MRCATAIVLFIAACARSEEFAFDAAQTAVGNLQLAKARELFAVAQKTDPDPVRRDKAAIALAKIEWRAYHDAAGARRDLALVDPHGKEIAHAWIERARLESELVQDIPAAREAAALAIEKASARDQRSRAATTQAIIIVEAARREWLAGKCADPAPLRSLAADLRGLIERDGPRLKPTQLLLDVSLTTGDMPTALQAWRWYYGAAPAVDTANRRNVALALANARLFPEAAMMLRDPCAATPIPIDGIAADVLAYESALRRIRALADEHYRKVAILQDDTDAFRRAIDDEGRALWNALSFPGPRPEYSQKELGYQLDRRFATVLNLGKTGNVFDLHLGHRVIDEQREVSQYGRRAMLRFIALDGIVSNGFSTWLRDGGGGDGGWSAAGVVYQVRPMYADGPVNLWLRTADPELRAKADRDIAEETQRDAARAAAEPIRFFPGLALRLERQAADGVVSELRGRGLSGDALRDAFIARVRSDQFESSIWAHEGRHAIDQKEGIKDSPELEFRAKLSEVALAPSPRLALVGGIIVGGIGDSTPHGKANKRVAEGLASWMRKHSSEIAGLDAAAPLLPQLDKLSDDQLRSAFRSMDPFAR